MCVYLFVRVCMCVFARVCVFLHVCVFVHAYMLACVCVSESLSVHLIFIVCYGGDFTILRGFVVVNILFLSCDITGLL